MVSFLKKHRALIVIVLLGAFLRFYKLDWGEGYFFHPDEYHIVISVEQLQFPSQMNPHFFSYGSFLIYLNYFTGLFLNLPNSFLIGRLYSALFSTLTIPLIYIISAIYKRKFFQLATAFLVAISPGLIQQAHFATPESTMIFFMFASLALWMSWTKTYSPKTFFISALTTGLAIATKITASVFVPVLLLLPLSKIKNKKNIYKSFRLMFISIFILIITYLAVSPYSLLDFKSFKHSLVYETGLGRGTNLVFYTRQFLNTIPFTFHFKNILPFALGPAIPVFSLGGFGLLIFLIIKKGKERKHMIPLMLIILSFCLFSIPSLFLFAKWTRFVAPTFPFFIIFSLAPFALLPIHRSIFWTALILPTVMWSAMFFSIYTKADVRIKANNWIENNVVGKILTETGNTIEVPFAKEKTLFNFYVLEKNPPQMAILVQELSNSDYFIIQSRRVFANHQRLPNIFPTNSNFYDKLFSGELGFVEVKEFTSYPKLEVGSLKLEIPDESAEETWSVFDHPVVRVYKKTSPLTVEKYIQLLRS